MELGRAPGYGDPYSEYVAYPSADGTIFFAYICDGPGTDDFQFFVFRQHRDGRVENIDLGQRLWHGHLMLWNDGLYVIGLWDVNGKNKKLHLLKVPGYVVPTPGMQPIPPVFIPTPQPAEDQTARSQAAKAVQDATTAKDRVNAVIRQLDDHLRNHPTAAAAQPVDWARVRQIAAEEGWGKGGDRFYAEAQAAMSDPSHWLRVLLLKVVAEELAKLGSGEPSPVPAPVVDIEAVVEKAVAALVKRLED